MGLRDRRLRHSLKDPVRGQFQVTGSYYAHPNGSSHRGMLTGVVTGPGVTATAGEHLDDTAGRYVGHDVLPALVDRSDPSRFIVLWDEIPKPDFRAQARAQAQQAADAARVTDPPVSSNQPPRAPSTPSTAFAAGAAEQSPSWATAMVADLIRQGVIPAGQDSTVAGGEHHPIVIDLPDQVLDLTGGQVSAADAANLMATGRPATALLVGLTEVPVPQQALPGPTASLCDLTLRVTQPDGNTYDARTRLGFRTAERRAAIAVIGATLPIRIDPGEPTRVVVDSATFDAQHPDLTKQPGL